MQYHKKLNYFLKDHEYSDFNVRIYRMLYNDLDISHLFEPVDFLIHLIMSFFSFGTIPYLPCKQPKARAGKKSRPPQKKQTKRPALHGMAFTFYPGGGLSSRKW